MSCIAFRGHVRSQQQLVAVRRTAASPMVMQHKVELYRVIYIYMYVYITFLTLFCVCLQTFGGQTATGG